MEVDPKLNVGGALEKAGGGGALADRGASGNNITFEAGEGAYSWACSFALADIASGLVHLGCSP